MLIQRKSKILFKYLFVYFIVVTAMALMMIPLYLTTLNSARRNSTALITRNIEDGVAQFERSIISVISLEEQMQSSVFSKVKMMSDSMFKPADQYKLIQLKDMLYKITRDINPGSVFYMMFHNNSKVITAYSGLTNAIYMRNTDFFSTYMVYELIGNEIFEHLLLPNDRNAEFIPSTPLRINLNPPEECVTFVTRNKGSSVTICAVYKTKELLSLFGMDNLPENSYLTLKYRDTDIISKNNEFLASNAYTPITFDIPSIEGVLTVGVPDSFFSEQVSKTEALLRFYLCSSFVLGLILACVFALYIYLPVYRLVKLNELNTSIVSETDDFEYLRNISNQYVRTNQDLRNKLDSVENTILESVLRNMLLTKTDSSFIKTEYLRMFNNTCRICLIDIGSDKSINTAYEISNDVYHALNYEGFLTIYITNNQLVSLLEESKLEVFKGVMDDISALVLHEYASRVTAVISYQFHGAEAVREAYLHAQLISIYSESTLTVAVESSGKLCNIHELFDIKQLTAAMRAGKEDKIRKIFKTSLSSLIKAGGTFEDVKKLYSMLSAAPMFILSEQKSSGHSYSVPAFDAFLQIGDQFNYLCDLCIEIMRQRLELSTGEETYKDRLIKYINENYQNPDIYATTIAEIFSISTKQVYRIVREYTGFGFSDYLDNLRISHAIKLLTQSGNKVKDIAQICGYNSANTFYKAFRKSTGYPPNKYRKMAIQSP